MRKLFLTIPPSKRVGRPDGETRTRPPRSPAEISRDRTRAFKSRRDKYLRNIRAVPGAKYSSQEDVIKA